jgi:hypothetical protein
LDISLSFLLRVFKSLKSRTINNIPYITEIINPISAMNHAGAHVCGKRNLISVVITKTPIFATNSIIITNGIVRAI